MKSILIALVLPAIAGCTFFEPTLVLPVRLPELPPHWQSAFSEEGYTVSWAATGYPEHDAGAGVPGEVIRLQLPHAVPLIVTATPELSGMEFAPAGAAWPLHAEEDGVLALSFEHGASAETLTRAATRGADLSTFSVNRFFTTVSEKLHSDPWQLDVEKIANAVAGRSMRESYIRPRELFAVPGTPPAGAWYPTSPFAAPLSVALEWPAVPMGVSRFASPDGRLLFVEVDNEGRAWVSNP